MNKGFIGQKALNEDSEKSISGETVEEILSELWLLSSSFIKREVLINGDDFIWADNEKASQDEMDKFLTLQDKVSKKTILVTELDFDSLRKLRGKHVNVFVYSYGKKSMQQSPPRQVFEPTFDAREA